MGVGLYAYYQTHPLAGEALRMFQEKGDRIFPIFICQVVPVGLKGLIMAAALAAAISTVMGVLTALSQTVMGAFYGPVRRRLLLARFGSPAAVEAQLESPGEHRRNLVLSRALIVFWGVVLCTLAYLTDYVAHKEPSILQLALAAAGYAGGALLGCFALAFLPLKVDGRGYMWSAPLSVAYVYALAWHNSASNSICIGFAILLLAGWLVYLITCRPRVGRDVGPRVLPAAVQTLALLLGLAGMLALNAYAQWTVIGPEGAPSRRRSHGPGTPRWAAWCRSCGATCWPDAGRRLRKPQRHRDTEKTSSERRADVPSNNSTVFSDIKAAPRSDGFHTAQSSSGVSSSN